MSSALQDVAVVGPVEHGDAAGEGLARHLAGDPGEPREDFRRRSRGGHGSGPHPAPLLGTERIELALPLLEPEGADEAGARPGQDQPVDAAGMARGDARRDDPAHGMAEQDSRFDAEPVQQAHRLIGPAVGCRFRRRVGAAEAGRIPADRAAAAGERPVLLFPGLGAAADSVHQQQGRAPAGLSVGDRAGPAEFRQGHGELPLIDAPAWWRRGRLRSRGCRPGRRCRCLLQCDA